MKSLTFFLVVPSGIKDVKCDAKEPRNNLPMRTTFGTGKHTVRRRNGLCGSHVRDSRAVSTNQLLIKDHKNSNIKNGEVVTRLIVPATNFTVAFAKVHIWVSKTSLTRIELAHSACTIIQAFSMKNSIRVN
jgi:hypothetical protein